MYDMHTHFIPPEVLTWIRDNQQTIHSTWERKSPGGSEFLTINHKWGFELKEGFVNSIKYLKEQSKAGITHSLISPIPQLFMYDFSTDITREMTQVYNQSLADWSQKNLDCISGLATVCLQEPAQAADDLHKAMTIGLKGAIIGPGIQDKMLSDDFFIPFWEEADAQRAIIFIHPLLSEDPRLKKRMMPNLIGIPWETTVCAADLLLSGLLDRYPNVKILLAHGGGYLPYQIGRLNKGYEMWPQVSGQLQSAPIEYLRRFWFDSVVWHPEALNYLKNVVGNDRIVPGSDYPFDLSVFPPPSVDSKGAETLMGKNFIKTSHI